MAQQDVAHEDVAREDGSPQENATRRSRRTPRALAALKGWRGVVLAVVVVAVVVVGGPALRSWWAGPTLDAARTWNPAASDAALDGASLSLALDGTGRAEAFPMVGADDGTCDASTAATYTGPVTWEKTGRGEIRLSGDGGRVSRVFTPGRFSSVDWSTVDVGVCGRGTPSSSVHALKSK